MRRTILPASLLGARSAALATVAIIALSVAGCSPTDEVATIDGLTELAGTGPAGDDAAEALRSCLTDADIPATLDWVDGKAVLGWEQAGHDIFANGPGGNLGYIRGRSNDYGSERAEAEFADFQAKYVGENASAFALEVDGVDYSAEFERCADGSGYSDPLATADPAEEMVGRQAMADVTNDWLACARENGYPTWEDISAGAPDNWFTNPTATIPLDMSPDALRSLLEVCPNFSAEIQDGIEDADPDGGGALVVQPSIRIEMPVPETADNGEIVRADEYGELEARHRELYDILSAEMASYYRGRAASEDAE
jgi:hypothetical protein